MRMSKALALGLLVTVLSGLSVGSAQAQVEEMVVEARGVEEKVRNIPVAITAISETKMQNYNIKSFEDVAALTPQLSIVRGSSGSGTSVIIRGIGANFSSIGIEQSVAIIIDGVYFTQGRAINEGLFDVEQVAILKGPQALFFGKNATAGVVSIRSKDPGDEFEALARIAYEVVDDALEGDAVISAPISNKFGVRLALRVKKQWGGYFFNEAGPGTYTTTDAATDIVTVHDVAAPLHPEWPREQSFMGRLTLKGDLSDAVTVRLKGSFADFEIASPTGAQELAACPALMGTPHTGALIPLPFECDGNWVNGNNPIPQLLAESNPLLGQFGGELGEDYKSYSFTGNVDFDYDKVSITSIFNYQYQRTRWTGDFDASANPNIWAGEWNNFKAFSGEVRAVTKFDGAFNFVMGVYYQTTKRHFDQDVIFLGTENSAAVDPTDRYTSYEKESETKGETWSIYAEVNWQIASEWLLTAGMRYLHETKDSFFAQPYVAPHPVAQALFFEGRVDADQSFDDAIPEVTLRWQPNDQVTIYIAYKQGFKSGGFSNSGILGAISGSVTDFTYDPESVKGVEGGIKAALFDNSLSIEFEAYYYKFKDLQIDFFNSPTFAFITTNAGGSVTKGAEFQFTWVPKGVNGLTINGSISYNIGEYTDFLAPCGAGQTPAQGCTIFIPGQVPQQQLAGKVRNLSPKWSGNLAVDYDTAIANGIMIGFSGNLQFRSRHSTNVFFSPIDFQSSYATLDLSARVYSENGRWQFSVIARNLTDKYAALNAGDNPSSGGGTGTEGGFLADRRTIPIAPRSITLELLFRY